MRHTPLHDEHEPLGGKLVEFGGWHMPVQYGPILEEVRCVRERVGLFDLSHMGRFNLTGPDAVAFVDRVATCYCARIPLGAIRYGLLCRPTGNPIDDILVYRSEDGIFLVVNAGNADADREWLLAHADGFEVALEDQTDDLAMIALQGPLSEESLARVTEGLDLSRLGYYRFDHGTVCGCPNVRDPHWYVPLAYEDALPSASGSSPARRSSLRTPSQRLSSRLFLGLFQQQLASAHAA